MAKLSRVTQKIFGDSAVSTQFGKFGSLAAGSPATTKDPAQIQELSNFLGGWFSAVIGGNSPTIEDMNSLHFLLFRQLAYIFENGMPEWDAATTYYIGSLVASSGVFYISLTDSNTGNLVSDTSKWKKIGGDVMAALGDLIYGGASGYQTKLSGNTTTTKKYLTQTGDGANSAAPAWAPLASPTVQKFLSGSGTYTTPAGVRYIKVKMVGGGGGGAGSGDSNAGAGSNGGNTTFGTSLLTAGGGNGAAAPNTGVMGGAGGSSTIGAGASGIALTGGYGGGAVKGLTSITAVSCPGGVGGASAFGGAGGSIYNAVGAAGADNTGAGGGGGGYDGTGANQYAGAGGGSGGYVEALIVAPSATYSYSVGAGGASGVAGNSGSHGGAGAAGLIMVEEHYQ